MGSMSATLAAVMSDWSLSACGKDLLDGYSAHAQSCAAQGSEISYGDLDTVIREDEGGVGGSELGGGHFCWVVEGGRMRCQYARVVEVCW